MLHLHGISIRRISNIRGNNFETTLKYLRNLFQKLTGCAIVPDGFRSTSLAFWVDRWLWSEIEIRLLKYIFHHSLLQFIDLYEPRKKESYTLNYKKKKTSNSHFTSYKPPKLRIISYTVVVLCGLNCIWLSVFRRRSEISVC